MFLAPLDMQGQRGHGEQEGLVPCDKVESLKGGLEAIGEDEAC